MKPAEKIGPILQLLDQHYADAHVTLDFSNPLELLVATVLSAQCTAVRVNKETSAIFKKYPTAAAYAAAPLADLVRRRFAGRLQPLLTDGGVLLQVVRQGVGKAAALTELLADVHLTSRDLLAVGDDMNDACMIEMAMRGVAMGNAPDALKRLADDVTASNADLGVAKTVEKYILSLPIDRTRGA